MSAATAPAMTPRNARDFLSSTCHPQLASVGSAVFRSASVRGDLSTAGVARSPSLRKEVAPLEPFQILLELGGALGDDVGALEVGAGAAHNRHGDAHDGKVLESPRAILHLDAVPLPIAL